MKTYRKKDLPVSEARLYLEPAPAVLVSSLYEGKSNIMTMGWYTVLEFTPSLVGCLISSANRSFEMIARSKECVINIPTADMIKTIVGIGNCSGSDTDKFKTFSLTAHPASEVKAPLIKECYANFECRLYDKVLRDKYNFFIMEIIKAHVAVSPKYPETVQYRGDSIFMVSGKNIKEYSEK